MWKSLLLSAASIFLLALAIGFTLNNAGAEQSVELLNVSYDPTRELYKDINEQFRSHYEKEKGVKVSIKVAHGGSGSQARSVIDGLKADVVTLALPSDIDQVRKKGLIADGWQQRLPNDSLPYYSTIVFVVRKGNPKGIKDWPDIIKPGVQIATPNPKTSGNGKLSFLAAWGFNRKLGKSEEEAREFVRKLYEQTPVLDGGARSTTVSFAQRKVGDVHLTWENEAHLELQEFPGELEIVYPSVSIRAEPKVAWVDKVVDRKGTREVAEAYLRYLYSDEAQETIAKHFYRPTNDKVLKKHTELLRPIELFPITLVAKDWEDANKRFFADGGVFDNIHPQRD
jgi:sulfate transport system substrate-binding protein